MRPLVTTFDKDKGQGASNRGRYSNPEVDKLIDEAMTTVDDAKRAALLGRKPRKSPSRTLAIIPSHYQVNTWAARKGLKYKARSDENTLAMGVVRVRCRLASPEGHRSAIRSATA